MSITQSLGEKIVLQMAPISNQFKTIRQLMVIGLFSFGELAKSCFSLVGCHKLNPEYLLAVSGASNLFDRLNTSRTGDGVNSDLGLFE